MRKMSLRRRLMTIFAISSILPILVAFYLNYESVLSGSLRTSIFLFISTVLSTLSLFLLRDVISGKT
ncbi:MAG: hypothetical protein ACOY3D_07865 [Candidatus Omnitrophota bacterium]